MLSIEDFTQKDVLSCQMFIEYNLQKGELKLSPKAATELRQLLEREDITNIKEYKKLLNQILKSQHSWHAELLSYTENSIDILFILGICFIVYLIFFKFRRFFYRLYKANLDLILQIIKQIVSAFGYFFPYIEACNAFTPALIQKYPYVGLLLPHFVTNAIYFYRGMRYVNIYYLFIVYFICIRSQFPKSRFIRFHWMNGVIIDQLLNSFLSFYYPVTRDLQENNLGGGVRGIALIAIILFLKIIIPPIIRALTGRYVQNEFQRDAVEIHLGREKNDPDFKWWNRRDRKKKPK